MAWVGNLQTVSAPLPTPLVFQLPPFLLSITVGLYCPDLPATPSTHHHRHQHLSYQKSTAIEPFHMGSASRASLVVAATISAVEALKDQAGLCRWNYVLRSLQQRANNRMGSLPQPKRAASSSSSFMEKQRGRALQRAADEVLKAKQSEALRTVMYLSCWGPN